MLHRLGTFSMTKVHWIFGRKSTGQATVRRALHFQPRTVSADLRPSCKNSSSWLDDPSRRASTRNRAKGSCTWASSTIIEFQNGNISIKPRVGKIDELITAMRDMKSREPRTASAAEVLHLAGSLVFLLYSCFDKIARGDLRPFYDWVTDRVDSATLWRTKDRHLALSPSVMGVIQFFLRALSLLEPRVY